MVTRAASRTNPSTDSTTASASRACPGPGQLSALCQADHALAPQPPFIPSAKVRSRDTATTPQPAPVQGQEPAAHSAASQPSAKPPQAARATVTAMRLRAAKTARDGGAQRAAVLAQAPAGDCSSPLTLEQGSGRTGRYGNGTGEGPSSLSIACRTSSKSCRSGARRAWLKSTLCCLSSSSTVIPASVFKP